MTKPVKTKAAILKKAEELGKEYENRYKGCAQSTFMAIIDALRWGGLELMPEEMETRFYPAIAALTAGVCMTGEGTCGAAAGSVMALGLATGDQKDRSDVAAVRRTAEAGRKLILNDFFTEYHSILCKDIQRKYFGKAWNLIDDKMSQEFLGITNGCIIAETARLAVKRILEEYEKGNLKQPVE